MHLYGSSTMMHRVPKIDVFHLQIVSENTA